MSDKYRIEIEKTVSDTGVERYYAWWWPEDGPEPERSDKGLIVDRDVDHCANWTVEESLREAKKVIDRLRSPKPGIVHTETY